MKPKGVLVLWKFKFCAKNHLVKVGTLNWSITHTVYIHKGTVQRHLWLIEGVYLPLRGKQAVFSLKKFAHVSLYLAKRDIKALWICLLVWNTANPYMTCRKSKKQGRVVTLQYVQAVPQCRKGAQAGFARLWSAWGRLSYSHCCALNPSIIEAFFFSLAYNQSV